MEEARTLVAETVRGLVDVLIEVCRPGPAASVEVGKRFVNHMTRMSKFTSEELPKVQSQLPKECDLFIEPLCQVCSDLSESMLPQLFFVPTDLPAASPEATVLLQKTTALLREILDLFLFFYGPNLSNIEMYRRLSSLDQQEVLVAQGKLVHEANPEWYAAYIEPLAKLALDLMNRTKFRIMNLIQAGLMP